MANLSASTEMPQSLDQRQIWFTNLLMLGFDPIAQEDKTKVRFCKEMFGHINKKGMEVTLHYLFNRLDSHIAYEEFRDCWPVYDKKQGAQFRKVCSNWMTRISKEDPESKIPRLSASLLMSPGGERFEQLMLRFTAHVLRVVCLREAKGEEKQVYLSSFVTSPASLHHSPSSTPHLLRRALQCHVIRHSQKVAQRLQLTSDLHDHWRQFVTDQVKEYRSLGREKRELEAQLKAVLSSSQHEGCSGGSTQAGDRARKSKMKMVRGYWKSLDGFLSKSSHEREVVGTVARGNANKYTIDAKDLQFQIPDVVQHLYEAKLREGTVGNTYEGGKLNLVSLLQLWNCALEVLRDTFRECEVPSFQEESEEMKELLQAHRVNLATSQNLRASLMEYQQSLREGIERLEEELRALRCQCGEGGDGGEGGEEGDGEERGDGDRHSGLQTPQQFHIPPITLPSLEMDLLPPSPHKAESLSSPDVRHLQNHLSHLSLPCDSCSTTVSTPEAVHNISMSVQRRSRSQQLAQSHSHPFPSSSSSPNSTLHPHQHHQKHHERPSATADTDSRRETSRGYLSSRKTSLIPVKKKQERHSKTRPHPPITSSARASEGRVAMETAPITSQERGPGSPPTNPRLMDAMPAAHDILASQIAAAMADDSPTSPHAPVPEIHSLADPVSALGNEAFVSHDKIQRTPVKDTTTVSEFSHCPPEFTPSHMSSAITPVCTDSPLTPVPSTSTIAHTLTGTTSLLTPLTNTLTSFLSSPQPSPHTSLISLQQPSPKSHSHSFTSPWLSKSSPNIFTSPNSPLHNVTVTPHHNVTVTPHHNTSLTPCNNVTRTPHQPTKGMSPLINFSPSVLPLLSSSTHHLASPSTFSLVGPSSDLMTFSSPVTSQGSTGQSLVGKSPGQGSTGPAHVVIGPDQGSTGPAHVVIGPDQGSTGPAHVVIDPDQGSTGPAHVIGSDQGSTGPAHVIGPDQGSTGPAHVIGSDQGSTGPAHVIGSDQGSTGPAHVIGPGKGSTGPAHVIGPDQGSTGPAHVVIGPDQGSTGPAHVGSPQEVCKSSLLESSGELAEGGNKSLVEHHSELKPNGIQLGAQIQSSANESSLVSASCLTSTRQTSSPVSSGAQLVDFSSPSLPPHSHLPSPSHNLPSPPPHLPIPASHVPSPSNLPLPSPRLPHPHLPANDTDDDREWRPLDISGSHSTSHSTSPPSPVNQSLKWVVEKHRLSSSGNGLFGENDSFLVPLSPHSDFSGGDDEH